MSSPTFRRESLTGRMRNLANMTKPVLEIDINGSRRPSVGALSYVQTYSTRDKIQGSVSLTAPHDIRFDSIHINFVGTIRTFVDRIGSTATVNGRTEAFHQFLKLEQPISEDLYPASRVAEAGKTYTFPFTFVVPDRLLPGSCKHAVVNSQIKDAHLELPPSLGEADLSGQGPTLLDDLAPDMSKVCYAVKVDVYRMRERDGKLQPLVSKQKKVRVIPAYSEHPPLTIDESSEEYCMRKEKNIRKGMFKGKLGRLVVEAAQPPSIHLPAPNTANITTIHTNPPQSLPDENARTTMATVLVRFEPDSANAEPPRLGNLTSRLKVATFYASGPRAAIPTKAILMYDVSQAVHVETLPLSQRAMSSAQWERHEPDSDAARRASTTSLSSSSTGIPLPSSTWASNPNRPFYTARLLVPVSLPTTKTFVPTFHSCLVSRIYILDMALSFPAATTSGVSTTMQIKVPVQLSSAANIDLAASSPATAYDAFATTDDELLIAAADNDADNADAFFAPRSVAPPQPSPEYVERSPAASAMWVSGSRGSVGRQLAAAAVVGAAARARAGAGEAPRAGPEAAPSLLLPSPLPPPSSQSQSQLQPQPQQSPGRAQAGGVAPPGYSLVAPRGSVSVAG